MAALDDGGVVEVDRPGFQVPLRGFQVIRHHGDVAAAFGIVDVFLFPDMEFFITHPEPLGAIGMVARDIVQAKRDREIINSRRLAANRDADQNVVYRFDS